MDFESPDDIESKPRKIPPSRPPVAPQTNHRNFMNDPDPDPDSDVDVQNDTKSEVEEMEGGSSDSDYYDPTLDNQDRYFPITFYENENHIIYPLYFPQYGFDGFRGQCAFRYRKQF